MTQQIMTSPEKGASLQAWLDYQLALHPTEIDMGLGRIRQVAQRLNVLDFGDTKVITVAGTNGKGTTCTMTESILRQAGKRVGVYSSPHMLKYNERVRVDGEDLPDSAFINAFEAIEKARGEISLTFFEYATLAGLYLLKAAKLDVALLEVGLGGRLDATNLIDADVAVITSIDLDHESYLGNTREAVGREKAGIFRTNQIAIIGEPNLPVTVSDYGIELGTQLYCVGEDFSYQVEQIDTASARCWQYQGQALITDLPIPTLPLPNAATTLAIIEQAFNDIEPKTIREGLAKAQLSGRLETVSEQPKVVLDVAHNPHAARYLAQQLVNLKAKQNNANTYALCGMLADKDVSGVLEVMAPHIDAWYLCDLDAERSISADELAKSLPETASRSSFNSLASAFGALKAQLLDTDMVIVFGSFYTVAEFKLLMEQEQSFVKSVS